MTAKTNRPFRTREVVLGESDLRAYNKFLDLVENGELKSKRQQCKWMVLNTSLTTGEIAKLLEIRFQMVYQYTTEERKNRVVVEAKKNDEVVLAIDEDEDEEEDEDDIELDDEPYDWNNQEDEEGQGY